MSRCGLYSEDALSGARPGRSEQYGFTGTALGNQEDACVHQDGRDQAILPAADAIAGMRLPPGALLFLLSSRHAFLTLQVRLDGLLSLPVMSSLFTSERSSEASVQGSLLMGAPGPVALPQGTSHDGPVPGNRSFSEAEAVEVAGMGAMGFPRRGTSEGPPELVKV